MSSFAFIQNRRAVTLLEALTVIVILGIAIFVTLPHLTNAKANGDLAAVKAKALQLNAAKDAYISLIGVNQAQINWTTPSTVNAGYTNDDNGRFQLLLNIFNPALAAGTALNGANGFAVPGYVFAFQPASGTSQKLVSAPVLIFQDANLSGVYNSADTQVSY